MKAADWWKDLGDGEWALYSGRSGLAVGWVFSSRTEPAAYLWSVEHVPSGASFSDRAPSPERARAAAERALGEARRTWAARR